MRLALLLLLALGAGAACTEHGSRPHLDLDVTAVPGTIKVYRPDADLCCTPLDPFPGDGACVFSTDAAACQDCTAHPSCFESFTLEGDLGSKLQILQPGMENMLTFSPTFQDGPLTLLAHGCGDDIRVPIPQTGPIPTLNVTTAPNGVDVSWTTDRAAAGAFVSVFPETCQTTASSHHFTGTSGIPEVITYDPPTVVESPTATFTVYAGNLARGDVPL